MATTKTYTKAIGVSNSSSSGTPYTLKLKVTLTKNTDNTTTVKMSGYIKSTKSAHYAYNLINGCLNKLSITDEDGNSKYSSSFRVKYDTRNTGNYDYLFTKTVNITHGKDGKRGIRIKWNLSDGAVDYKPVGTLYAPSSSGYIELTRTSYTIKYDANGGKYTPEKDTKYYGTALTLPNMPEEHSKYTEDGTTYKFVGWALTDNATTYKYKPGGKYTRNASDTLYAVWQETTGDDSGSGDGTTVFAVGIIYDENGEDVSNMPHTQSKLIGQDITLDNDDITPLRKGYTFVNWNTEPDGSGTAYNPGDIYTIDENLVLFAQWSAWTSTVKFDLNGGTGTFSDIAISYDEEVSIPEEIPTKKGCIFRHWVTDSGDVINPGSTVSGSLITTDKFAITLKAEWADHNIYIYNTGKCKAWGFSEIPKLDKKVPCAFHSSGMVCAPEIVEANDVKLKSKEFSFSSLEGYEASFLDTDVKGDLRVDGEINIIKTSSTTSSDGDNAEYEDTDDGRFQSIMEYLYPVGCVHITNERVNPSKTLGGKWELIHKGFSYLYKGAEEAKSFFKVKAKDFVDVSLLYLIRTENEIRFRLEVKTKKEFSDDSIIIGNLNLEELGVTRLNQTFYNLSTTDSIQAIMSKVNEQNGNIVIYDTYGTTGSEPKFEVGKKIYLDYTLNILSPSRLDKACDKFYWERV